MNVHNIQQHQKSWNLSRKINQSNTAILINGLIINKVIITLTEGKFSVKISLHWQNYIIIVKTHVKILIHNEILNIQFLI